MPFKCISVSPCLSSPDKNTSSVPQSLSVNVIITSSVARDLHTLDNRFELRYTADLPRNYDDGSTPHTLGLQERKTEET